MWIERLEDFAALDLAPPLKNLAAAEVMGVPVDEVENAAWTLADFDGHNEELVDLLDLALARLSGRASRERRVTRRIIMATKTAARRTKAEPEGAVGVEELACRVCGCTEENGCAGGCSWVLDQNGVETDLCTCCVDADNGLFDGVICSRCGTTFAGDVEACPVCLRTSGLRPLKQSPLPSSLGPMNGEVVAGDPPADRDEVDDAEVHLVDPALIDPSPYQPRQDFGDVEDLAASIRLHGILQAGLVRRKGDRYELVFGERRLRAARQVGLAAFPAKIRQLSDKEAADLCAEENVRRKVLNAIEEARQIQILQEVGFTQEEIAARLAEKDGQAKSQPWVSNRLRLLGLPAEWQERIITQEIPPTHARELLKWKHRPKVLKQAAKELAKRKEDGAPSVKEFAELLSDAAAEVSRSLNSYDCAFKVTPELRERLDIETVDFSWGGSNERAFNTSLFDKLNKQGRAERAQAAEERAKREAARSSSGKKAGRGPTQGPGEMAIWDRVTPWLASEILRRVKKTDRDLVLRLLLLFDLRIAGDDGFLDLELDTSRELLGLPAGTNKFDFKLEDRLTGWSVLAKATPAKLGAIAWGVVSRALQDTAEVGKHWNAPDAPILASVLTHVGGDPLAYRLTQEDVELYPDEALRQVLTDHNVPLLSKTSRAGLVAGVFEIAKDGWLPDEFRQVLAPAAAKKSPKRKAKPR